MLNDSKDWQEGREPSHVCHVSLTDKEYRCVETGCCWFLNCICYNVRLEIPSCGVPVNEVKHCPIREGEEHNPDICGCHYIGLNMWDCGHTDHE